MSFQFSRSVGRNFAAACFILWTGSFARAQAPRVELLEVITEALIHHPQVAAQHAQIEIARGAKDIETGAFDPLIQSGLNHNLTTAQPLVAGPVAVLRGTETVNQSAFSVNGSKLFRDGISVDPYYQINRNLDSYLYPNGYNSAAVGVTVNVPLLRGRGTKVVAARERAAEMEIQASQHDFDFLLASLASNVAQDYWSLVAAYRGLDIARSAESRAKAYVENTQALIDADHVPRSDINEVRANLAQRTAARISAENALVVAQQQLSQAIGRSAEDILNPLGEPAEHFPVAPRDLSDVSDQPLQQRFSQALARRADYLAATQRKEKVEILLPAARNALRPRLDVSIGGGYQGLRAGRALDDLLLSPLSGVVGPTVSGGLTYSYPFGNHAAIGGLEETEASLVQADVAVRESARNISEGITVSFEGIRSAILRVGQTRLTVEITQEALEGAREKYRAGFGSVVEILQVEDRLNSAFADQTQAQLDYALALTQYRFSVGTLVPVNHRVPIIRKEAFFAPISTQQP